MGRLQAGGRQKSRALLLRAAAAHFARLGFDGASVDEISQDAGFAKGTLYNYFASKEALFAAVIEEACRRAVAGYRAVPDGGSVRERLLALAEADLAVLREEEEFTRVLVREAMSFRSRTYGLITEHLEPIVAVIEEILRAGAAQGEVRTDRPPAELALLFVGVLSLLYVQYWGSKAAWPALDDIPALAVTTFLDGASHTPPRPRKGGAGPA